jgi:hypothetical protein
MLAVVVVEVTHQLMHLEVLGVAVRAQQSILQMLVLELQTQVAAAVAAVVVLPAVAVQVVQA